MASCLLFRWLGCLLFSLPLYLQLLRLFLLIALWLHLPRALTQPAASPSYCLSPSYLFWQLQQLVAVVPLLLSPPAHAAQLYSSAVALARPFLHASGFFHVVVGSLFVVDTFLSRRGLLHSYARDHSTVYSAAVTFADGRFLPVAPSLPLATSSMADPSQAASRRFLCWRILIRRLAVDSRSPCRPPSLVLAAIPCVAPRPSTFCSLPLSRIFLALTIGSTTTTSTDLSLLRIVQPPWDAQTTRSTVISSVDPYLPM